MAAAQATTGSGWDRWAPAAGIAYVVLYVAAILTFGEFPASDDPAADFAAYYADDRGTYIAGSLLAVPAFAFFIWFSGGLASRLRAGGLPAPASVAVIAAGAYVAISLTSIGITLGLVAMPAGGEVDAAVIKAVEAMSDGAWILGWLPLAVLVLAYGTSAPRLGLAPAWFAPASIVSALILLAATTTWAEQGFWSPFGGFVVFVAAALFIWTATAAVLGLRRRDNHAEGATR